MNPAHVHLVLNHIPVLGVVFGLVLLSAALFQRNDVLQRAALLMLAAAALTAGPVFFSGEPAEETVEELAGVSERAIEPHEEAAQAALAASAILAVAALAAWWLLRRGRPAARGAVRAALALGVVAAALLIRTAARGGQIRHSELRAGAAAAEDRDHDDDHSGRREPR